MSLKAEIAAFISTGHGDFETLALALFDWQRRQNPMLDALVEAEPTHWWQLPAVPVELFKDIDFACFDLKKPHSIFHTSGTTVGRPGRHHSLDTELYDLGAPIQLRRCIPQLPSRIVSLCPPAGGHSSLGHMLALFGTVEGYFDAVTGLKPGVWAALEQPCFLATTAFALDALFGQEGRAQVGPDSLVMVTGGFKGRRVRLDAPELYREIGRRLGSPRVVGEYGMTELSSQLWTDPVPAGELPGAFVAPPWMRIYTVDPATGAPLSEGEVGQLRFVDLANYWSVLAIETMDLGRVVPHPEGDRVWLHGRLQGAEVRGCSLSVEELLGLSSATE